MLKIFVPVNLILIAIKLESNNKYPTQMKSTSINILSCKYKKHGNAMKPDFHATIALYLLKLLALGSWCDECIVIYFKTSSFSKLARILQSN